MMSQLQLESITQHTAGVEPLTTSSGGLVLQFSPEEKRGQTFFPLENRSSRRCCMSRNAAICWSQTEMQFISYGTNCCCRGKRCLEETECVTPETWGTLVFHQWWSSVSLRHALQCPVSPLEKVPNDRTAAKISAKIRISLLLTQGSTFQFSVI